jgi:hypothetical protein
MGMVLSIASIVIFPKEILDNYQESKTSGMW